MHPYKDLARAGKRLRGLMGTLLFKRLKSSVEAFRQSVAGLIQRHKLFLRGLDDGIVIAGEQVEDLHKGIEPGDAKRNDLVAELEKLFEKYQLGNFGAERSHALPDQEALLGRCKPSGSTHHRRTSEPDRRALGEVVFDVLGLTDGEREAVHETVINLLGAWLEKARSV